MSVSPRSRGTGGALGLPALLTAAAGLWFVIGPALWPTFESTPAFATGAPARGRRLRIRPARVSAPASCWPSLEGWPRTRDQLYEEARRRGISGRSKMSKAELERALKR